MTDTKTTKMEFELSPDIGLIQKKSSFNEIITQELEGTGLKFSTIEEKVEQPDGTVKIRYRRQFEGVVEGYEAVYKFLAGNPCWFLGCEQLREELNTAITNAKASGCSECEARSIKRRFIPKIKAAIDAHVAAGGENPKTIKPRPIIKINRDVKSPTAGKKNSDTRIVEVPGSGSTSIKRTGAIEKLLRRTANCIKKIFRTSKTKGESRK